MTLAMLQCTMGTQMAFHPCLLSRMESPTSVNAPSNSPHCILASTDGDSFPIFPRFHFLDLSLYTSLNNVHVISKNMPLVIPNCTNPNFVHERLLWNICLANDRRINVIDSTCRFFFSAPVDPTLCGPLDKNSSSSRSR